MPWEEFPMIWKTKSEWWVWLRGILRKGWSKSPVKLEFIKQNRQRILNEKGKEVWGGTCNVCKKQFVSKNMNVDHIVDAGKLTEMDDVVPFIKKLLMCSKSNLQYVCIPCHKIKNHSLRKGINIEDAKAEKEAISIIKNKKDKEFLIEKGIIPEKNAKLRREQIISFLK